VERGGLRILQKESDFADAEAEILEKDAGELAAYIVQDVPE
jgi:hypothetical protein